MTSEYRVSLYGRAVYFLKLIIYLPISLGALAAAISPLPYSEPGLFGKIVLIFIGSSGTLWSAGFIRQIFRFSPRICISDIGIKYSGFYLNTLFTWEEISSFSFSTIKGGFTVLGVNFKKRKWLICKGITLDASGLTPGYEKLNEEMWFHYGNKNGI